MWQKERTKRVNENIRMQCTRITFFFDCSANEEFSAGIYYNFRRIQSRFSIFIKQLIENDITDQYEYQT